MSKTAGDHASFGRGYRSHPYPAPHRAADISRQRLPGTPGLHVPQRHRSPAVAGQADRPVAGPRFPARRRSHRRQPEPHRLLARPGAPPGEVRGHPLSAWTPGIYERPDAAAVASLRAQFPSADHPGGRAARLLQGLRVPRPRLRGRQNTRHLAPRWRGSVAREYCRRKSPRTGWAGGCICSATCPTRRPITRRATCSYCPRSHAARRSASCNWRPWPAASRSSIPRWIPASPLSRVMRKRG